MSEAIEDSPTSKAYVLAGPSGVGKGTVLHELLARAPKCWLSVSATTRPPRPDEKDGVHYRFVSDEEFDLLVETGQMLEWAWVHDHRYGTPLQPIIAAQKAGKIPILEVDLDGARQVRESYPEIVQIFLAPPSWEELEHRLRGRGTESEEEVLRRLKTARVELAAQKEFDYVVLNDSVARATDELLQIMQIPQ